MIPGVKIIDDILKGLPENARLRSDNTKLVAENETLKLQVKHQAVQIQALKDKYEAPAALLPDEQWDVLRLLATKDDYWRPQAVATGLGIDVVRVHSLLAKLQLDKHVFQAVPGYRITTAGRAALL